MPNSNPVAVSQNSRNGHNGHRSWPLSSRLKFRSGSSKRMAEELMTEADRLRREADSLDATAVALLESAAILDGATS